MNATMEVLALCEMSEVEVDNESNGIEAIEQKTQSNGSIVAEMTKLVQERQRLSLSGILCARHSMTTRSMNATQDKDRCGGQGGGAANSG